eukprot:1171557-Rhodomonas_salina.1
MWHGCTALRSALPRRGTGQRCQDVTSRFASDRTHFRKEVHTHQKIIIKIPGHGDAETHTPKTKNKLPGHGDAVHVHVGVSQTHQVDLRQREREREREKEREGEPDRQQAGEKKENKKGHSAKRGMSAKCFGGVQTWGALTSAMQRKGFIRNSSRARWYHTHARADASVPCS